MTIKCTSCGSFEVSEPNFKELCELPEDHWQIQYLRNAIGNLKCLSVISKPVNAAFQVSPLKSRLTKMNKASLRRKAEGKQHVVGYVVYRGKDDQTST